MATLEWMDQQLLNHTSLVRYCSGLSLFGTTRNNLDEICISKSLSISVSIFVKFLDTELLGQGLAEC